MINTSAALVGSTPDMAPGEEIMLVPGFGIDIIITVMGVTPYEIEMCRVKE